jgi:hypothetical protein
VGSFHTSTTSHRTLILRWRSFSWRFLFQVPSFIFLSLMSLFRCAPESLGLQSDRWDTCSHSLLSWFIWFWWWEYFVWC